MMLATIIHSSYSSPPWSGETFRLRSNEPGSRNGRVPEAGVDGVMPLRSRLQTRGGVAQINVTRRTKPVDGFQDGLTAITCGLPSKIGRGPRSVETKRASGEFYSGHGGKWLTSCGDVPTEPLFETGKQKSEGVWNTPSRCGATDKPG